MSLNKGLAGELKANDSIFSESDMKQIAHTSYRMCFILNRANYVNNFREQENGAKDWDSNKDLYPLRDAQQLAIQVNKLHGKLKRGTITGMNSDSLPKMCVEIGKFAKELIRKLSPDDVRNREPAKKTNKEDIASKNEA
jgi:hypothetical protein